MLAFLPVVYLTLSCLGDILDGGHEDCCSSLYTLVSRVCLYATGILDSFLSEEGASDRDLYLVVVVGVL